MGTSRSTAELVDKLDRFAKDVGDVRIPLEATAQRGKQIFVASAGGVIGKTVAGKRKAIGARYDLTNRRSSGVGEGQAVVTYTGPAHLLNNPTKAHPIVARRLGATRRHRKTAIAGLEAGFGVGSGLFGSLLAATRTTRSGATRSNGAAALFFGGDEFAAYVRRHPGTKGKHFFERAREVAEVELPRTFQQKGLSEPLGRAFG